MTGLMTSIVMYRVGGLIMTGRQLPIMASIYHLLTHRSADVVWIHHVCRGSILTVRVLTMIVLPIRFTFLRLLCLLGNCLGLLLSFMKTNCGCST